LGELNHTERSAHRRSSPIVGDGLQTREAPAYKRGVPTESRASRWHRAGVEPDRERV